MAFFGLFDYCRDCGTLKSKKNLDKNRRCSYCALKASSKSSPQQKAAPRQPTVRPSPSDSLHRPPQQNATSRQLNMAEQIIREYRNQIVDDIPARGNIYASATCGDCVLAYRYPNVSVSNVNRSIMKEMATKKDYRMDLSISESDEVVAQKDGQTVAIIKDQVQMCIDWIQKQQPVVCEFAYFTEGKEKVALFFYRNETAKMEGNPFEVVKLTSCFSEEKQDSIACLEEGQKLFIETDDNDKPYVRDIWYHPIGRLPAKFNRLYENDAILGLYFDHSETKESEDFDKDDKQIPYIKVYYSK